MDAFGVKHDTENEQSGAELSDTVHAKTSEFRERRSARIEADWVDYPAVQPVSRCCSQAEAWRVTRQATAEPASSEIGGCSVSQGSVGVQVDPINCLYYSQVERSTTQQAVAQDSNEKSDTARV